MSSFCYKCSSNSMKCFLVWVYTIKALLVFINKVFEFIFVCFSLIYGWKQEDNRLFVWETIRKKLIKSSASLNIFSWLVVRFNLLDITREKKFLLNFKLNPSIIIAKSHFIFEFLHKIMRKCILKIFSFKYYWLSEGKIFVFGKFIVRPFKWGIAFEA